ncbi:MAG TPA: hypothetical protein VK547_03950 [Candidatus Udaeobacter sp.]|jgi:uncharacterized protein (TIGR03066 family)|nr:hypothetical protein [Candidatus Udaeobacter sp.]
MARPGRGVALLLALALALGAAAPARAEDNGWLLGRWELVRSPEGDKKDWLEFAADGRMTSITPDGRRLGGQYAVTGSEVQLNYKIGSQSILITLTYGPDKARLYARSARTGYTAVYEKRP